MDGRFCCQRRVHDLGGGAVMKTFAVVYDDVDHADAVTLVMARSKQEAQEQVESIRGVLVLNVYEYRQVA